MGTLLILDFQVYPIALKIRAPIQEKKGLLLYAKNSNGDVAWAEVSPLAGFSIETLDEAKDQLNSLRKEILDPFFDITKKGGLYPSVAFGLDSLFYSLTHTVKKGTSYPVCAFLAGSFKEIESQIYFLLQEGYQHIKLKVAQLSFEEAHQVIEQLLGKVSLKIDVNRAWNLKKSLSFFSRYPLDAFEYIEEPVDDIKDLSFFPYPIALDETLREGFQPAGFPQIKALIVKPMLTGGLKSIQKIVDLSKQIKAQLVLSSSYESGVGLFHLCSLLDRAKIPLYPLGVDTYRLIHQDVLVKPHDFSGGRLLLSALEISDKEFMCQ